MHLRRWKYKAHLQRALSAAPFGSRLNYAFQRASGGLPISDAALADSVDAAVRHISSLHEFGACESTAASLFEFGAGWDLHMPLALSALGVHHQTVVDIRPLLRAALVHDAAGRIAARLDTSDEPTSAERVPLLRIPIGSRRSGHSAALGGWLAQLGIEYRAPADARRTGLPTHSIDLATSTNTLEHIPAEDIRAIMRELRRTLARDGVASFQIDYQDHWSYFDPTITVYNFLRYSESEWAGYNPDLHHQNRLRHDDYVDLFRESGFTILQADRTEASREDLATLETLPLDRAYADRDLADIGVRTGWFVLKAT